MALEARRKPDKKKNGGDHGKWFFVGRGGVVGVYLY